MGLGIEPDFATPPVFERNKVQIADAVATPIGCEGGVYRGDVIQDLDAELVAQAQDGKLEAFEELVRRDTP